MTRAHPRTPSRLRVCLTLARALGITVVAVVVYFLLPLTAEVDWDPAAPRRRARGLRRGDRLAAPGHRPVALPDAARGETLAVAIPVFLLLFAATYALMSRAQPTAFTEPMDRSDALYFTVTVFATVGFGDIAAVSTSARMVVTLQMIADLLLLGIVLRAVLGAVKRGRGRRDEEQPA